MAVAAILKNRKISISQPLFERFRRSLARLRSSTLLTVPNVKNFKFWKSKMVTAAILKNRVFWPRFERFRRNLAHWCTYHNLPWYWYCFRMRARLDGKGRFWCAACNSVNQTCSMSTLFVAGILWNNVPATKKKQLIYAFLLIVITFVLTAKIIITY